MTTPPQTAIGDLVPLMYRARWARFGLSGEVRSRTADTGSGAWQERESFEVAPDGRYRFEVIDGEGDRELRTGDSAGGPVPLPELMVPAGRLLPDFDVQITGQTEFLGRAVIAISGSPRLAGRARRERVSGLVDAELGILLRCQRVGPAQTDSAEFTNLTVGPAQPPGREQDPGPLPGVRPSGRNSIGQQMPVLTDEEVNLLYRSDLGPQRFAGQLSEQTDAATMMRLAGEALAATKFGSRTQWLWRPYGDHAFEDVDRVARVAVAMPGRYLIEAITDPGRKPARIACNARQLWRAYPDRVAVRAAEPLPREIATIIDPAWLLDELYQVSVLGEAEVDGRPALHVRAAGDWLPPHSGPLSGTPVFSDQVEVFIDRELGICLRQLSSYQGHPVMRTELTGLATEADPASSTSRRRPESMSSPAACSPSGVRHQPASPPTWGKAPPASPSNSAADGSTGTTLPNPVASTTRAEPASRPAGKTQSCEAVDWTGAVGQNPQDHLAWRRARQPWVSLCSRAPGACGRRMSCVTALAAELSCAGESELLPAGPSHLWVSAIEVEPSALPRAALAPHLIEVLPYSGRYPVRCTQLPWGRA